MINYCQKTIWTWRSSIFPRFFMYWQYSISTFHQYIIFMFYNLLSISAGKAELHFLHCCLPAILKVPHCGHRTLVMWRHFAQRGLSSGLHREHWARGICGASSLAIFSSFTGCRIMPHLLHFWLAAKLYQPHSGQSRIALSFGLRWHLWQVGLHAKHCGIALSSLCIFY